MSEAVLGGSILLSTERGSVGARSYDATESFCSCDAMRCNATKCCADPVPFVNMKLLAVKRDRKSLMQLQSVTFQGRAARLRLVNAKLFAMKEEQNSLMSLHATLMGFEIVEESRVPLHSRKRRTVEMLVEIRRYLIGTEYFCSFRIRWT